MLDLRRAGEVFDDVSAQLVATATALLNWHDSGPVQPGGRRADQTGQGRLVAVDPVTGHEEFPRIDPAVICLVHDGGDRAVLGAPDGVARADGSRCWPDSSRPASRSSPA